MSSHNLNEIESVSVDNNQTDSKQDEILYEVQITSQSNESNNKKNFEFNNDNMTEKKKEKKKGKKEREKEGKEEEIMKLQERFIKMRTRYRKNVQKLKNARKVIKRLKTNIGINNDNIFPKVIKKILNRDQIKLLIGECKKMSLE